MMTTTTPADSGKDVSDKESKPMLAAPPSALDKFLVAAFSTVPFLLLVAAVPLAMLWGWGPSLLDWTMMIVLYVISCLGIGVGNHRYFTHGAFKAKQPLRVALAVAGMLALQGPLTQWVGDHRRHHQYADEKYDPHSPWRFGTRWTQILRGLQYAHFLWLFKRELSNCDRFAPDLVADKTIQRLDKLFPVFVLISLAGPGLIGGSVMGTWHGALSGVIWAGFVRVAFLHQVTWSINSICHVFGKQTFKTRGKDRATNFWPLALFSFGESWHNSHHADPTCARHGVERGQLDINARTIWVFEKFGWVWDVRWPKMEGFEKKRIQPAAA
jgi:stearoyl-CoA desaturase (delta-9 desaturase)